MTTKHTPGPWTIKAGFIVAEASGWKGAFVAKPLHVDIDNKVSDTPRAEANARLIAAAPDMLAALELVAPIYAHIDQRDTSPFGVTGRTVNAAIAKAKGEA